MFTGLTRQEQRTALALIGVVAVGLAVHQLRGQSQLADLVIDAATQEILVERISESNETGGSSGASAANRGPVDLNTASLTELTSLPGIGEVRARSIIDHRARQGPFSSVDALIDVAGIGPATLGRLRPLVTVAESVSQESGPGQEPVPMGAALAPSPQPPHAVPAPATAAIEGRVNVNTASLSELTTLPGIGEVIAQRIIERRRIHGPFRRPEDLLEVNRIGPRTLARIGPLIEF